MWKEHIEEVLKKFSGKDIELAGDCRYDSPGFNASWGTYTLMEVTTGLVLVQVTLHVSQVKNSHWLEVEGLKACLNKLKEVRVLHNLFIFSRLPLDVSYIDERGEEGV